MTHRPVYFLAGHSAMALWNPQDLFWFWANAKKNAYFTQNQRHVKLILMQETDSYVQGLVKLVLNQMT